jgi:hypothetical protein
VCTTPTRTEQEAPTFKAEEKIMSTLAKVTKTWDYSNATIAISSTDKDNQFKVKATVTVWTTYDGDAKMIATELVSVPQKKLTIQVLDDFIMDGRKVVVTAKVKADDIDAAHDLFSGIANY